MEERKLKDLKKGEWFTLSPIEYPTEKQVYIKDDYDRSEGKYLVIKWADALGSGRLLKGSRVVFTGFTF